MERTERRTGKFRSRIRSIDSGSMEITSQQEAEFVVVVKERLAVDIVIVV